MKKFLFRSGFPVGLILTAISLVVFFMSIPFLELVELKAYDLHFISRGRTEPGPEVAIITVDEKSIDALGRWPWPRSRMSELVDKLGEYGASVVAFDIVFSEPDNTSGLKYFEEVKKELTKKGYDVSSSIDKLSAANDNDTLFADSLKKNPSVVLGYFFYTSESEIIHRAEGKKDKLEEDGIYPSSFSIIRRLDSSVTNPDIIGTYGIEENIKPLSKQASDFGFFNVVPDRDGTIRQVPLVMEYDGLYYPHLSLEAIRKYVGSPPLMLNLAEYGVDSIMIGSNYINSDERAVSLINYRGPKMTFPYYSFSDVLSGKVPEQALRDKIILVGVSAIGVYDLRVTPFAPAYPGIEVQATIIDNILGGDFIFRPDWIVIFDIGAILILGIIFSILITKLNAVLGTLSVLIVSAGYIYANNYVFNIMHMWLSIVYPIFTIFFVSAGVTIFRFMTEEKKKREIKKAFSHYVAPSLVDIVVKNPEIMKLGGEEKRLSVLFSDIRGFTTLSEGLTPQTLVKLMNDYLTPMTDIVFDNNGTVDKYMGDAVMAFWGAPVDMEDHAYKACATALQMMRALPGLQSQWQAYGVKEVDIGIGISTGRVTVGNMGSQARFDYTVIGDSVNLGSRLEGLNKEYKTHIIVARYTQVDVISDFIFRELDYVRVKGKAKHIAIHELMGFKGDDQKLLDLKECFEAGLKYYREMDWDRAESHFKKCLEIEPSDGPAAIFIERVATLRQQDMPEKWSGVYVMTSK